MTLVNFTKGAKVFKSLSISCPQNMVTIEHNNEWLKKFLLQLKTSHLKSFHVYLIANKHDYILFMYIENFGIDMYCVLNFHLLDLVHLDQIFAYSFIKKSNKEL